MAQLQKGTIYTATGGGLDLVTYSNLNAHVDSAVLLPGAITSQTPLTVTDAADVALVSDTSAAGALSAVPLANLVPAGTLTATQATEAHRSSQHQYAAGTISGATGAEVYAVTLDPAATLLTGGMMIKFLASATNTGAASVNVNALGAIPLKWNGSDALPASFIRAGQMVEAIYDGTNFQVLSAPWNNYIASASLATAFTLPAINYYKTPPGSEYALSAGQFTGDVVHGLSGVPNLVDWKLVCQTGGDNGFLAGDEISMANVINWFSLGGGGQFYWAQAFTSGANATKIWASLGSTAVAYYFVAKTGGATSALTLTKWKAKVSAIYLP